MDLEVQIWWQALYFVDLGVPISWQALCFVDLMQFLFRCSCSTLWTLRFHGQSQCVVNLEAQTSWQAQYFVDLEAKDLVAGAILFGS